MEKAGVPLGGEDLLEALRTAEMRALNLEHEIKRRAELTADYRKHVSTREGQVQRSESLAREKTLWAS